jgi:signal transduction histidine kinase
MLVQFIANHPAPIIPPAAVAVVAGMDSFLRPDEALASVAAPAAKESGRLRLDATAHRVPTSTAFLMHELRNLVNTAMMAFAVLQRGEVGVAGRTGAVLDRSLTNLQDLIARSVDDARVSAGNQHPERTAVADLVNGLGDAASMEAGARGRTLVIAAVDAALMIEVDRKVLSAVIVNLLQNAFKFSPRGSTVRLTVGGSVDRVLIEIEDECGGLPGGLWRGPVPAVRAAGRRSQRNGDRSRVLPMGRRGEPRSSLRAEPAWQRLRFYRRFAAIFRAARVLNWTAAGTGPS